MNTDIRELLALDTAVNQITKQYGIPLSIAAFRLFRDIRDYIKIGGLKKELSTLYLHKFAITEACSRQSQFLINLANLKRYGLTQDKILELNDFLQKNGIKEEI